MNKVKTSKSNDAHQTNSIFVKRPPPLVECAQWLEVRDAYFFLYFATGEGTYFALQDMTYTTDAKDPKNPGLCYHDWAGTHAMALGMALKIKRSITHPDVVSGTEEAGSVVFDTSAMAFEYFTESEYLGVPEGMTLQRAMEIAGAPEGHFLCEARIPLSAWQVEFRENLLADWKKRAGR